ncbi:MAG: hypothetical protein WC655_27670 [Candidatus Hydrogenedentales bacterium]|jgi:hypothetical protein
MAQRDYFAELYVAGLMGDAGWNVYFPKRDMGFDFIATKSVSHNIIIRPVQVKGLYPSEAKGDKTGYGYVGKLTHVHPQMALVLPYFPTDARGVAPDYVAFMPRQEIKAQTSKGFKCFPCNFVGGRATPRSSFRKFFGYPGMELMETSGWSTAL